MEYRTPHVLFLFVIVFYFGVFLNDYSHAQLIDPRQSVPGWTENCISCICEASSGCNETVGCIEGNYCGMFLIGEEYWRDADSPVLDGDDPSRPKAFERCALDPFCTSKAVNRYIQKFAQDCNRDRFVNCDDHVRLHYLGRTQCSIRIQHLPYYQTFQNCMRQLTTESRG
uniref:lysozyme n=1 Tax=Cacopsylla melanoneura TaxID=428564 RepID=A0A8D8XUN0_9HEMI